MVDTRSEALGRLVLGQFMPTTLIYSVNCPICEGTPGYVVMRNKKGREHHAQGPIVLL